MSKASNERYWAATKAFHAALAEQHPGVFDLYAPIPLKRGLHDDLLAIYPDKESLIHRVLRWLTMRRAYLKACVEGAQRYDLQRHPTEMISAAHAKHAAERFAYREATSKPQHADVSLDVENAAKD